ncbi:MAG: CPBP family intramembrane metalloprotease [Clostridia bacterium]|nr:CPBP family intramembrane metalloprotease [Clostridia bacterium]
MDTPEISFDFKKPKKAFSRIGIALILFFFATTLAQIAIIFVISAAVAVLSPDTPLVELSNTALLILSAATMYLVGFPVYYLTIRSLPKDCPEKKRCGFGTIGIALLISITLMYAGQTLGTYAYLGISELFGVELISESLELISSIKWYEAFLFSVIIGPFVEELMFRKLLIDRTRMYGEKLAMIFSALMFAFFHTSVQQFFYAFLIGLLYAYLYLRRGKMVYCWLLHALFNFFGSVVPLIIYEFVDIDEFLNIFTSNDYEAMYRLIEENLLGYGMLACYGMLLMAASTAGFVLLIVKMRKARFKKTALQLPKDSEATVAFTSVGVILFIIFTIAYPFLVAYLNSLAINLN